MQAWYEISSDFDLNLLIVVMKFMLELIYSVSILSRKLGTDLLHCPGKCWRKENALVVLRFYSPFYST